MFTAPKTFSVHIVASEMPQVKPKASPNCRIRPCVSWKKMAAEWFGAPFSHTVNFHLSPCAACLFSFKLLCSLHFGLNFVRITTFLSRPASDVILRGKVSGAQKWQISSVKEASRMDQSAYTCTGCLELALFQSRASVLLTCMFFLDLVGLEGWLTDFTEPFLPCLALVPRSG